MHVDNKAKNTSTLGEEPPKGLYDTTATAEAKYRIIFTPSGKRFVLSLQATVEAKVSYLLMLQNYINLKQKTLEKIIMYYV